MADQSGTPQPIEVQISTDKTYDVIVTLVTPEGVTPVVNEQVNPILVN